MSWRTEKLNDIASVFDGTHQTPLYVETGVPFYSVEQVTSNNFCETKYIAEDVFANEKNRIEKGDILMTRIGDIGTAKYIDWDVKASYYVSLALIKTHSESDARFMSYYISTENFQRELLKKALLVAFPYKINLNDIGKCNIFLPLIDEQRKIVMVMRVFDDYLEKVQKKLEASRLLKKGLSQQIFSGKIRFKDDNGQNFPDWKKRKIDEITIERVEKTAESNQYKILTSSRRGVFKQDEYFGKNVANKDNVGYKILRRGDFVYRAMTDDDIFVFNYNDKFDIGSVSPAYAVFGAKNILPSILRELLNSEVVASQLLGVIQGGTRKSLKFSSLRTIKLDIPDIIEQQKIADFLSSIDNQIDYLEQLLNKAKEQKKWLLDNLVTGKIRLKEFRDE